MKQVPRYETESAMCADFSKWAKVQGWTPYAETAGWDLLLVASDGTQIGVQAKLKFNLKVIEQTIPDSWDAWRDRGPDYRAILVPVKGTNCRHICGALGLAVFYAGGRAGDFYPELGSGYSEWHFWNPKKRHVLPEFVPDVAAGSSAPVQLTRWKIAALRISALLDVRGYVTREDFKRYGIDHRRWTGPGGWLEANGTPGQYRWRENTKGFGDQHPVVYPQILEDIREWLAQEAKMPKQGEMVRL